MNIGIDDIVTEDPAPIQGRRARAASSKKRRSVARRLAMGKRIHRGFHRIGLVFGAGLCVLIFFGAFAAREDVYAEVIFAGVALGIAFYALMRAIGWIVLGFLE